MNEYELPTTVGTTTNNITLPTTVVRSDVDSIPARRKIRGWRLKKPLYYTYRYHPLDPEPWLLVHCYYHIEEYGVGKTYKKAQGDLVSSLGELKESLAERKDLLSPELLEALEYLEGLIERVQPPHHTTQEMP